MGHRNRRARVEAVLACLSACSFVATLLVPDWIELVLPWEPDGGSGLLEWGVAAVAAVATVGFGWAARRHRSGPAPVAGTG